MALTPSINEEISKEAYKTPKKDTSDKDLILIFNAWKKESEDYHNDLEKIWKVNEEYYHISFKDARTYLEGMILPEFYLDPMANFQDVKTWTFGGILPLPIVYQPRIEAIYKYEVPYKKHKLDFADPKIVRFFDISETLRIEYKYNFLNSLFRNLPRELFLDCCRINLNATETTPDPRENIFAECMEEINKSVKILLRKKTGAGRPLQRVPSYSIIHHEDDYYNLYDLAYLLDENQILPDISRRIQTKYEYEFYEFIRMCNKIYKTVINI